MKKKVIVVSITLLLVSGIAIAYNSSEAQKFFTMTCAKTNLKGPEAAVCDLYQRVVALEARAPIPGPQGIQGVKGDKGDKGDPGDPSWDEARIAALEARLSELENPPVPPACTAIICDDFNSYNNGLIVGQGGWLNRDNGSFWSNQDSVAQEGTKALYNNYNNNGQFYSASAIQKFSTVSLADGKQSFYVRTKDRSNWGDERPDNVQVGVYQGGNDGPARTTMSFRKDGTVTYVDPSGTRISFDTYLDNTWNLVDIEWRFSDKSSRFRLNNANWTNWIPFTGGNNFTGFDSVVLTTWYLGTGGVYMDDLH